MLTRSMRKCEVANGKITQYRAYLLIYSFLFSLVLHTGVYDCFRFVCTFESLCLNNCKMKKSNQRTLFEFDVFAKTKKWESTDTVVVVVRTCISNVAISDEMAPALTALYRGVYTI